LKEDWGEVNPGSAERGRGIQVIRVISPHYQKRPDLARLCEGRGSPPNRCPEGEEGRSGVLSGKGKKGVKGIVQTTREFFRQGGRGGEPPAEKSCKKARTREVLAQDSQGGEGGVI